MVATRERLMRKRRTPTADHWQARRREYLAEAGRDDDLKLEEREWREQAAREREELQQHSFRWRRES
jgi:hypothetical protein